MISDFNPLYSQMLPYWERLRDLYAGEAVVKRKGTKYLPASAGMILDGCGSSNPNSSGNLAYNRYKQRAEYINHIKDAVDTYIGLCHQERPTIQLPSEMEYLYTKATRDGQSLETLLRMINTEQVKIGRCGLLVDLATSKNGSKPYIAFYDAESIINWNETDNSLGETPLSMVVLKEEVPVLENFSWHDEERYRVCLLGDGSNIKSTDTYKQGVFVDTIFSESMMITPSYLGKTLNEIPFVFVNACDCSSKPDYPPLDDLGNQSISAYCLSADYKQALHMQGQDTLLIKGRVINSELKQEQVGSDYSDARQQGIRTGAGSVINVTPDGDAKFIGVSGDGIPEMRQALDNAYSRCEAKAGKLIARGESFESGESLKTRLTAQTATLNQIALTGAFALERCLKIIARWIGANEDEVVVKPNLEFSDFSNTADDLVKLMTAKDLGCPISYESIYEYMISHGYVKVPFVTQIKMLKKEKKTNIGDVLKSEKTDVLKNSNSGLNPLNGINKDNRLTDKTNVDKVNGI